nr:CHASE domain-containing protein [Bacteroidota bacterium]
MEKIIRLKYWMPVIIAVLLFAILIFATIRYTNYKKGLWEKDIRARMLEILVAKKSKLEKALYSRIYYTRSIAAYVSLHPDITREEFDNLANELIKNDSVICTIAISKNCIIGSVFPVKGHEAAIGLNLLAHPERREIVEKTIETHQTFIAGPVELIEGGQAFISYTPIFDKTQNKEDAFWGVTDIVIYQYPLLEDAGLKENEYGFHFSLKGYNGQGEDGAAFWGDESIFNLSPVKVNIELPYGNWILAAIPHNGWPSFADQDKILLMAMIISSLIISILIGLFSRAMVKIKMNEQELTAIFNSMNSLVIELNSEGRYLKIAPTKKELLFLPEDQLLNKTLYEIFDEKTAKFFHDSILKCLNTKKLVVIDYPLTINGEKKWFAARLSWKSENTVILQAYDITDQKKFQQELAKYAKNLKELNATKDRFFSIIAHDLKSPFNQILGFSELLLNEYDEMTLEERKKMIGIINSSSNQTVWLINNLLNWSQSQRGLLKYNPEPINLKYHVTENIKTFSNTALAKDISLSLDIDENLVVISDSDMLSTILRNLLSNAIKFTPKGGSVIINTNQLHGERENLFEVVVADTGTGIDAENMGRLFAIDSNISKDGTGAEKGTGLGLILCRELVEKMGQTIRAESEPGKGSRFIFTLANE